MTKKNMKAQSPMLSHTMLITFGIILVIVVIVTMNSVRSDYQNFIAKEEAREVCSLLKAGIEEIYNPTDYLMQHETKMAELIIQLPDKIGNLPYNCRFVNTSLVVSTFGAASINRTCEAGYDILFSGIVSGGRIKLIWKRYENNSDSIEMINI